MAVHVPLTALNRVTDEGFDWQIPGHRAELVGALVRGLPKDVRRELIPMNETIAAALGALGAPHGRLVDALADVLREQTGVGVEPEMFDLRGVPAHLRMNVVVADADGTVHDADDDLGAIKRRLAATTREAIAAAAPIAERRGMVTWDVGTLPQVVETAGPGIAATGYPALLDDDTSVSLRVLTNADLQRRVMLGGVRRLLLLTAAPSTRDVLKGLDPRGAPGHRRQRASTSTGSSPTARSRPSTTCCASTSCRGTPTRSPSCSGWCAGRPRASRPGRWCGPADVLRRGRRRSAPASSG